MKLIQNIRKLGYEKRIILIAKITMTFNYLWSITKITIGLTTFSKYIVINGIFTLLIALSKNLCIWGINKNEEKKSENISLYVGFLLLLANLFYIIYMIMILEYHDDQPFTLLLSILISTFSFTNLALAIIGINRTKKKIPLLNSIKVISLMTALNDIALTQKAILSVTTANQNSRYNALIGIIVGLIGVFVSLILIYKGYKRKKINII